MPDSAVAALLAQGRPRADAQRNVERLVAATREALDELGLAVTTRDIAQRAGVGLGTLYRRVPSLDALLAAILTDTIDEMTDRAAHVLDAPDPWQGFAEFAETYVQLRASSCGLHDALSGRGERLDLEPRVTRLQRAMRQLVQRAQQAGTLRADLGWRDVPFALATAIPPDHTIGLVPSDDQWRRNLRIILDGLRPPRSPAPAAPAVLADPSE
ncbi:TetR/AcrR family transcriptional regulator [Amycolatopsis rubida]|uniref:TetR/AcrR family transcriptional regulator n=1 Tax=Amycolatopsis rubida TaxID=112413 RepID=A0ABX0C2N3_9PSEU|nr:MULTISPECIES: TetR/AcrR family transcriptional regulator [Amycolatopsis]MYW95464.1 TetR family transcriptional regulator [Amycolatopsis rubida]NEC60453.1 TetR/AcrR family transcriptional regulator [Amycolatopsis rubida]OAP22709.1 Bacterial regulatory protein, tetR family [Amycolatopsis sp. M39]